ncbi:phosphatase PAP2 family protein [Geodermatophilus sp. DF01-2]|uniref:phosphatase PAP2 family protein n=1 Tax=Geodermatophilus sp. DF01-2 TaxID=2559610 RepID=UPI0010745B7E|nr:phosphatase PAP2 family protein [Geodermatophilus sp. DF01_2]TFV64141.1 phosphatase PAP2 family protein [Geodermatophilus sp. DF01_2]
MSALVLLGQRAVCLGVILVWLAARFARDRDPRPLITVAVATLLLNVTVGAMKILTGRLGPLQLGDRIGEPGAAEVFTVGMAFPSGHSANAVLMWALLVHLSRRHRRLGAVLAGLLAVTVGSATIYLGTHWVTDVWAGWAAGALVLLVLPAMAPVVDRIAAVADRRTPEAWRLVRTGDRPHRRTGHRVPTPITTTVGPGRPAVECTPTR